MTGRDPEFQRRLLGRRLRAEKGDAPYAQLLEFWTEPPEGRVQEEQMARCFLLYFIPVLRNIGEIARFDLGGAALGVCYAFMGSLSRGAGKSLGGYWQVWELWTYEILDMYPPTMSCLDDTILPRALRWSKEYRGVKKGNGDLNADRLYLDELRPDRVHWCIWDRFEIPYVAQSREVTRGMVLLESPYGSEWYLGDRVSRESLRLDTLLVLGPLLPLVLTMSEYMLEEVERFTQPDSQLKPLI
ncbi:protein MAINTENANCE OF MERISTEMS-like [Rhododendron vialii]|uniref:protein MAINTENANCE OF MERISTEMS-like n=1 Tax=Rhododendron vialii TaxID=182163 RepID=UPI00265F88BA|nr:protein MAINTENANCE OF MERISTEMS-like [Rhododendron vialii]